MAPVYAFGVAFVVALVLGLVLRPDAAPAQAGTTSTTEPTPTTTAGPAAGVRQVRVAYRGDKTMIRNLFRAGVDVTVETADGRRTIRLDESGRADLPAGAFTRVCAALPAETGWVARAPSERVGDGVCTTPSSGAPSNGVVNIYADLGG